MKKNKFFVGDAVDVINRGRNCPDWHAAFKLLNMNIKSTDNYSEEIDERFPWIVKGIMYSKYNECFYYYIVCPTTRRKLLISEYGIKLNNTFPKERLIKFKKEKYVVKEI